ncbi:hypothetical protein [Dickeya dianthicola]|uniref:hypothetical protein n=1 Tax=Dickeya dianthicola TaxID=204039 RepID=UPI0003D6D976|nr:hypothetical protein [Dickeya dianthicola]MBT1429049.1 hypothetical protein [Dickeya dianthicola]MBT1433079.1 hypothetical protein [Dickeya dianthicola]MBT1460550.1 hypothetical protein [Dickeya dianthicola]MBT1489747.1 hypothetical protein [Dickeya dianthicola]MCA7002864.1 hypothetical protein [Dickeya dianthicola]
MEALHDSLAQEVAGFGIKVTLIEPGAYATDFASPMSLQISEGLEAYKALRQRVFAQTAHIDFGEPQATGQAVLQLQNLAQLDHPFLSHLTSRASFT